MLFRSLLSYLVTEAEEQKIPLIFNAQIEEALDEILLHINKTISRHFPPSS